MTPPSAAAVANWFLDKADADGYPLDQLQIQKLVYYANGWYLANVSEELFYDDVVAWPHGPVIRSLWAQFREFGRGPISDRARELQIEPGQNILEGKFAIPHLADVSRIEVCEKVWEQYGRGRFTGIQLSNMTHAKDEPWEVVRRFCRVDERPIIPTTVIRDAFKRKLEAAKAAA